MTEDKVKPLDFVMDVFTQDLEFERKRRTYLDDKAGVFAKYSELIVAILSSLLVIGGSVLGAEWFQNVVTSTIVYLYIISMACFVSTAVLSLWAQGIQKYKTQYFPLALSAVKNLTKRKLKQLTYVKEQRLQLLVETLDSFKQNNDTKVRWILRAGIPLMIGIGLISLAAGWTGLNIVHVLLSGAGG